MLRHEAKISYTPSNQIHQQNAINNRLKTRPKALLRPVFLMHFVDDLVKDNLFLLANPMVL